MSLEVLDRLRLHGQRQAEREALREVGGTQGRGRSLTYAELAALVDSTAREVTSACRGHDRPVVLLCLPNQVECVAGMLGVLAAGATAFPVHPLLTDVELREAARRSRAAALIGTPRAREAVAELGVRWVGVGESAKAMGSRSRGGTKGGPPRLYLQSSGTTGRPKIVERSAAALDAVARNVAKSVGLREDDRVLGWVPACHSYGVENVVLGPIYAGCSVHLCRDVDAATVLGELEGGGVTVFPGVPAMFEMLAGGAQGGGRPPAAGHLCQRPFRGRWDTVAPANPLCGRPAALRCAYSAGAMLPASVYEAFARRFKVSIGQLYGMTEIGSVTFNDPARAAHAPGSVGWPMDGVRIRVVERSEDEAGTDVPVGTEGEVAVSAPSMLTGYLNDEDGTCCVPEEVKDGYFHTGDLGKLDAEGRLTITGRRKLVVDVGGLKVNLLEVEAVLCAHEAVEAAVVTAVPVSDTVCRLKAVAVLRSRSKGVSAEELRTWLRRRLSAHKVPRSIEFRTSLPRSATGKVLRGEL